MPGFEVHEVLECEEPYAVCLRFSKEGYGGAAVEAVTDPGGADELADAVRRAGVQAGGAVGLGLKTDADVFDRAGEEGWKGLIGGRWGGRGEGEVLFAIPAVAPAR